MKPSMPKEITVNQDKEAVTVDGEPFPYYVSPDGVEAGYDSQGMPIVTVPILAERVTHQIENTTTTYELNRH